MLPLHFLLAAMPPCRSQAEGEYQQVLLALHWLQRHRMLPLARQNTPCTLPHWT
jgi:hypothetical protein